MKISTSALLVLLALGLAACSVGPARRPAGASTAPVPEGPAPVPAATLAERYAEALDLMRRHQDAEAIEQMRTLANGGHSGPLINLGILYARQGRASEAADALRQALALAPGHPVAAQWLASVLREGGELLRAEQVLQASLRVAPDNPATHRNLAVLYEIDLQRPDRALQHYRRYQQLSADEDLIVEAWIRSLQEAPDAMRLAEMKR